ncbi:suppressor of fused domain protein [Gordonia sp. DT101]|uniref:suppressor of fused domain protein n=1 Tax=Gordonia sp. DT101 TaxID=3416545 RepID=UPI003CF81F0F
MSDAVTDRINEYLAERLDARPQRASVTFLGVEPIDVARFVTGDDLVYVTVGCARHPMSEPTDIHADPVRGPRAELVVRMHAGAPLPGLHRRMATLAAAPAVEGLIIGEDALIDLSEPVWDGAACTAVLLEADELGELALDKPMDPVRFLRAVPITANEAAWVRLKGATALREAWAEAGIDVRSSDRAAAKL